MNFKSISLLILAVIVYMCSASYVIADDETQPSQIAPAQQTESSQSQPQPVPAASDQQNQSPTQEKNVENPFLSLWFWTSLVLFIAVVTFSIIRQYSALIRPSGHVFGIEDAAEEETASSGPWSEYQGLLKGERFCTGTDLYEKSVEQAQHQAQAYIDALKQKVIASPDGLNTRPVQEELQALADSFHPDFVKTICSSDSFWMKKVFPSGKSVPSDISNLVCRLFRPIQAPVGRQIQHEIPAWTIAVLVVLGAVIGSWLTGLIAWICKMQGPSDFIAFFGATSGAVIFASGIYWVTVNEKYRQWLEKTVFAALGVDTILQVAKLISPVNFFGSKKTIDGVFFKRLCLYLAVILLLIMTKRKDSFNYSDYLHKLEPLYLEQIQGIVLFVASLNQSDTLFDKKWQEEENQWRYQEAALLKKIENLQMLNENAGQSSKNIGEMYGYICDLWKADIQNLEPILHDLALQFENCGFQVPEGPMKFVGQINQSSGSSSNAPEKPVEPPAK